jgi:hypothetical protein
LKNELLSDFWLIYNCHLMKIYLKRFYLRLWVTLSDREEKYPP